MKHLIICLGLKHSKHWTIESGFLKRWSGTNRDMFWNSNFNLNLKPSTQSCLLNVHFSLCAVCVHPHRRLWLIDTFTYKSSAYSTSIEYKHCHVIMLHSWHVELRKVMCDFKRFIIECQVWREKQEINNSVLTWTFKNQMIIPKYLRQFCYSYWWRAHHMGVYNLCLCNQ